VHGAAEWSSSCGQSSPTGSLGRPLRDGGTPGASTGRAALNVSIGMNGGRKFTVARRRKAEFRSAQVRRPGRGCKPTEISLLVYRPQVVTLQTNCAVGSDYAGHGDVAGSCRLAEGNGPNLVSSCHKDQDSLPEQETTGAAGIRRLQRPRRSFMAWVDRSREMPGSVASQPGGTIDYFLCSGFFSGAGPPCGL
jgi:hypothetical protein